MRHSDRSRPRGSSGSPPAHRLRRCAEILAGADVRLAIEFLLILVRVDVDGALDLCDEIGWDGAGLLVDSWHTLVTGQVGTLAGLSGTESPWCSTATAWSPSPARARRQP